MPEFQGVAHWLTFKESYLELLEWVVSKVCEQTFHSSCHQGKAKIAGIALTAAVKKSVCELLGRPTINIGVTIAVYRGMVAKRGLKPCTALPRLKLLPRITANYLTSGYQ